MRLTVVGCAAAWGRGAEAASSCYLVEAGDTAIVLDLGQGAFARLATLRRPESLAAILVSHSHADHCVDLVPLRHYLRYEARATAGTVALHAPADLPARFDALTGESGFLDDLAFSPVAPGELRFGPLRVTAARVAHTDDSYAFRVVEDGADDGAASALVYSGDCGDPADLIPLLRPGDTLLAEASFGAGPVPAGVPHLGAAGAAQAARDGGAARLLLTHLQPDVDPEVALERASALFPGETALARPTLALDM